MELETERLLLREFTLVDWPAVMAYQNDSKYLLYYRWKHRSSSEVRDFVQGFIEWQRQKPRRKYQLIATLKKSGELIGNCGIRGRDENDFEGELGYEVAPNYWGKGYATEAARVVLDFGFDVLKLERVSAECVLENRGSSRVLEKLGMRWEGHLRRNQRMKGRWWDTLVYGILREEWEAAKNVG
jgi:ribosomal-protein-alanine N-acetyltransferase